METKNHEHVHMNTESCPSCAAEGHKDNAKYCFKCGHFLEDYS